MQNPEGLGVSVNRHGCHTVLCGEFMELDVHLVGKRSRPKPDESYEIEGGWPSFKDCHENLSQMTGNYPERIVG